MKNKTNKNNDWKIWEKSPEYGKALYYKSAIGELGEMESAKAICKIIDPLYEKGTKVLDVGCGAGHYLRSFKARVDEKMNYTGDDGTEYFVKLAKKAFGKNYKFLKGDIFNLQFKKNEFDLVICSNVILHLPPPPAKAISELIRGAKKYVVIRTVFGERNYIIKEVRNVSEKNKSVKKSLLNIFDKEGQPLSYNFFNMYSEQYFRDVIFKIDKNIKIKIVCDDDWKPFDNRIKGGDTATRIVDGKQVSGNLILNWKFIILEKNEKK